MGIRTTRGCLEVQGTPGIAYNHPSIIGYISRLKAGVRLYP